MSGGSEPLPRRRPIPGPTPRAGSARRVSYIAPLAYVDGAFEFAFPTGVPLGKILSSLHEIEVSRRGGSQAQVRLRDVAELPNREKGAPLEKAKATILWMIQHLRPSDSFQVVSLSNRAEFL